MKNRNQIKKKILGGMILLLGISLWPLFQANADGWYDCVVEDQYDGYDGRDSMTLRTALERASNSNRGDQRCRHQITIKTPIINLTRPLVVNVQYTDQQNLGGNRYYVIKSETPNGQRATLSFNGYTPPSGSDPTKKCALIFRGTNHVLLQNINIESVRTISGICFENEVNNITLDNVRVAQVHGGGHGIVVFSSAHDITVNSNSALDVIDGEGGSGLYILNTDELANIVLNGTSRESSGTDPNGTATFPDNDSTATDFSMSAINGEFVHSEEPGQVLLSEVNTTAEEGQYRIRGAVVKDAVRYIPQFPDGDADFQSHLEQRLTRIQVYAVGAQAQRNRDNPNQTQNPTFFMTYVTPQSACVEPTQCQYGLRGSNNGVGAGGNFAGIFEFILDTTSILERVNQQRDANEQIASVSKIILLPELANGSIASASKVIELIGGNTQTDVDPSAVQTGGGSGGSAGSIYGWASQQACINARNSGGGRVNHPSAFDSDGDSIPDIIEDDNGDCGCTVNELSCWSNPDTDGDGIPDPAEMLGGTISVLVGFCDGGQIPGIPLTNTAGHVDDLCDVNEDGISNGQSQDSDGDTLLDGEEDRARIFVPERTAYLYVWNGVNASPSPYHDGEGNKVECTQDLIDLNMVQVGALYGIYRVQTDGAREPVLDQGLTVEAGSDEVLMVLSCRNESVTSANDFNGVYNQANGETSAYLERTRTDRADDNVCHGGRLVSTVCVLDCINGEIFRLVPEEYLDVTRSILKLDTVEPRIPLLYKQTSDFIRSHCADMDHDGIPDCVESETSVCSQMSGPSGLDGRNLNPYSNDTDADEKVDGVTSGDETPDICPFTIDETCDQRQVYAHRPILANFLDRDKDGLKDAEEDLNKDGVVQTQGGLAGRATTETSPLLKDSDGDRIDDIIEVQTWNRYTNPADADTDVDGLPDSLEVRDFTATPQRTYTVTNGLGCSTFIHVAPAQSITDLIALAVPTVVVPGANNVRLGTDPANTDTDLDGIPDGVEVTCADLSGSMQAALANGFPTAGIDICSNPLSLDSDGDSLNDAPEYAKSGFDGLMQYNESSPCDQNTDGDSNGDDNIDHCPTSPNATCQTVGTDGPDSDGDGLSDAKESLLRTNATLADTDGDGLLDGEEDIGHDGRIDFSAGDTNPTCQILAGETPPDELHADPSCAGKDTDSDGLLDSTERVLTTNPSIADSDGDGILDGVEMHFRQSPQITGADTDPNNPDTDGDGMCDGGSNVTNGGASGDVTCIRGEDLNNNGIRDVDARNANRFTEFDPKTADSDGDGDTDKDEACRGGQCLTPDNIVAGNSGSNQGCFSLSAAGSPIGPSSMLWIYGLLVMANRVFTKRVKMWTRKK